MGSSTGTAECIGAIKTGSALFRKRSPRELTIFTLRWPEITVVGISINAGDENSDAMKRAGAAAVLPKDKAVEHLHAAIVQMAEG